MIISKYWDFSGRKVWMWVFMWNYSWIWEKIREKLFWYGVSGLFFQSLILSYPFTCKGFFQTVSSFYWGFWRFLFIFRSFTRFLSAIIAAGGYIIGHWFLINAPAVEKSYSQKQKSCRINHTSEIFIHFMRICRA